MRVVKVKESGNETASYTYDANGNKKSETLANGVVSTYTYNKANRITKLENKSGNTDISSYEYSYYLDGSDACKIHNESGIIETTSYEYDGLTRLTEEAVKVGNNTTDTYAYEYDDYGNRSKMTAAGTEDFVTEYSYVDSNGKYTALLQKEVKTVENEADENLITLNPASDVKQTVYTYDSNGNKSEYTYYTQNAHGDVVNLTDTDGEVIKSYTYDAFGVEKNIDNDDTNAFRYCGEYYDTETGTIYLRARYYDPEIGRFISRDTFTGKDSDPLSLNLYTYCGNNPILYVDIDGHKVFDLGGNWIARIDSEKTGINKRHVHLEYKGGKKSYSQNDDGSPHDKGKNLPGNPPKKVLKKLKEKTGWDWKAQEASFYEQTKYENISDLNIRIKYADGTTAIVKNKQPLMNPSDVFDVDDLRSYYGTEDEYSYKEGNVYDDKFGFLPLPYVGPVPNFNFDFFFGFSPVPIF